MSISASQVKELREKTGAGMMDCKKALSEANGDFEAATDWLRTKGLAAAAKKSGRVAAEGLVAVASAMKKAAIIEVNSETDFVARNDKFQALVSSVAQLALSNNDIDALKNAKHSSGKSVADEITENIATIGENLSLRRVTALEVQNGVVASYIHNAVAPNLGKIAVIVALESNASNLEKLEQLGKQIAMHVAAARPIALNESEVDGATIEREKQIFSEQAKASGKPDNIIEKMVEGRIKKFYAEVVLPQQTFVIDGKSSVADYVAAVAKELGAPIQISGFARFELGEGIEQAETDFAAEVAAVAGK